MNFKRSNLDVDFIRCHPQSGAALSDCIRDAIIMASTEWRNVEFIHNDRLYRINCNDLLSVAFEKKE